MTWAITVPFTDRADSLVDVAARCRKLDAPEDREVMREIVIGAAMDGARTAGDLLDRLAALGRDERRELLDGARAAVGLPHTAEVDEQRAWQAAQQSRTFSDPGHPRCAHDGCRQLPVDEFGALRRVSVNRWWCPLHVEEAAPGDMDARPADLRISPSGAIVPVDPHQDLRARADEESRRARLEAEQAARALEAGEIETRKREHRDRLLREMPDEMRGLVK